MRRDSLFYIITIGFIFGIGLAGMISNFLVLMITLGVSMVLCFLCCVTEHSLYKNKILHQYSLPFLFLICSSGIICGAFRFHITLSQHGDKQLRHYLHQSFEAEGRVVNDPEHGDKTTKIIVAVDMMRSENNHEKIKPTKVTLGDDLYSSVQYGDEVHISGELELPQPFVTDSGSVFQYDKYLAKDAIYYIVNNPQVRVVGSGGNFIYHFLYSIKHAFINKLNETISFPESTLAAGLTVAGKGALPPDVLDDFNRSGTLQVVVLSGYNVTIVAETFMALFSFLPIFLSSVFGVISIILFTILAGGTATIVRGSIMAIIVIIARYFNRTYNVYRSLIMSAFVMLAINPLLLQYDPSFQFSFLATLGLLFGTPLVMPYIKWIPSRLGIREATAATVASQIAVLPIILYSSGALSLMSLFSNILLFLVIPSTMLLCFVAGIGGFLSVTLVIPAAWCAWLFLWYELKIVHIFAHIPFTFMTISAIPLSVVYLVYACYIVIIIRFSGHETSETPSIT